MITTHIDQTDISPSSPKLREAERNAINEKIKEYLESGKQIEKVANSTIQELKIVFNDTLRNERREFSKARERAREIVRRKKKLNNLESSYEKIRDSTY